MKITVATKGLLLLAAAVCAVSCSEGIEKQPENGEGAVDLASQAAFALPPSVDSARATVVRIDVNGDRWEDAVVMMKPVSDAERELGFDTLFVYEYIPNARAYKVSLQREYFYAKEVSTLRAKESYFQVWTDAGGQSAVSSRGAEIFRLVGGKLSSLYRAEEGNPEVMRLGADSATLAIAIREEFWPSLLARAEAIEYVDSLALLEGDAEAFNGHVQAYFSALYAQAAAQLEELMSGAGADSQFDLYQAAVHTALYAQRCGKAAEAKARIVSKKSVLRKKLPADYYEAVIDIANEQSPSI